MNRLADQSRIEVRLLSSSPSAAESGEVMGQSDEAATVFHPDHYLKPLRAFGSRGQEETVTPTGLEPS
jgi:hypothetical protein